MTLDDLRPVAKDALNAGAADYADGEAWALACGLSLRAASLVGLLVAAAILRTLMGQGALE